MDVEAPALRPKGAGLTVALCTPSEALLAAVDV